jgi:hypothetical protein
MEGAAPRYAGWPARAIAICAGKNGRDRFPLSRTVGMRANRRIGERVGRSGVSVEGEIEVERDFRRNPADQESIDSARKEA